MKPRAQYFPETDTLAIELEDHEAAEAEEIAEDIILHYDAQNQVVSFTIEHASELLQSYFLVRKSAPVSRTDLA